MKSKDQQLLEEAYKTVLESSASMRRGKIISSREADKNYRAFLTNEEDALALENLIRKKGLKEQGAMIVQREDYSPAVYLLVPKELLPSDYYLSIKRFVNDLLRGTDIRDMSLYPINTSNYNLVELTDAYKEMTKELPELEGIF